MDEWVLEITYSLFGVTLVAIMSLGTIAWFAAGGVFTSMYVNGMRYLPLYAFPGRTAVCGVIGTGLGLLAHNYEEDAKVRIAKRRERLLEKYGDQ